MNINNLISDLNTNNIVCYNILHTGKCQSYCKYHKGHNTTDYIDVEDNNISRIPCRFLLKESGCKAVDKKTEHILTNWRTSETSEDSCISDKYHEHCKHNHFYKPKYICPVYFYNTSLNKQEKSKLLPDCYNCGKLHISWNNYDKNILNSRVYNKSKGKAIDFLIAMVFNLSVKSEYNETVFDDLLKLHKSYKDTLEKLNIAYNSKCIKCKLPSHKPKLKAPKETTVWALQSILPLDLIRVVSSYMYKRHDYHPNGCADCIFMIERPTYTISDNKCYELYNLSKLSGYGERAVSSSKPKFICVNSYGSLRTINDCSIDDYSDKNRDAILNMITL
tara:strand:- start:5380 stop:6381 length:1002 start_codon:yes stop_codon:yes gene_type:complete